MNKCCCEANNKINVFRFVRLQHRSYCTCGKPVAGVKRRRRPRRRLRGRLAQHSRRIFGRRIEVRCVFCHLDHVVSNVGRAAPRGRLFVAPHRGTALEVCAKRLKTSRLATGKRCESIVMALWRVVYYALYQEHMKPVRQPSYIARSPSQPRKQPAWKTSSEESAERARKKSYEQCQMSRW